MSAPTRRPHDFGRNLRITYKVRNEHWDNSCCDLKQCSFPKNPVNAILHTELNTMIYEWERERGYKRTHSYRAHMWSECLLNSFIQIESMLACETVRVSRALSPLVAIVNIQIRANDKAVCSRFARVQSYSMLYSINYTDAAQISWARPHVLRYGAQSVLHCALFEAVCKKFRCRRAWSSFNM